MSVRIRWHAGHGAYSLWDSDTGWVDKFGRASDEYYCETREVAVMRRRDLNQYRKDLEATKRTNGSERRSNATLDVPPTMDIATIETAAESLMRLGDVRNAIALWAIALRLRGEANA